MFTKIDSIALDNVTGGWGPGDNGPLADGTKNTKTPPPRKFYPNNLPPQSGFTWWQTW